MICPACVLELKQQDKRSPGVVRDIEYIGRAAFTNHVGESLIKASFISKKQFMSGEVSVWRMNATEGDDFETVFSKLKPPPKESVYAIFAVTASAIRAGIQLDDENGVMADVDAGRYCIIDECDIDLMGGFDPLHAHIKHCFSTDNEDQLDNLRQRLRLIITRGIIWRPS